MLDSIFSAGDWRGRHRDTIIEFLNFLNIKSDNFILKGGTALMVCYGLDRFSEDIDLDSTDKTISEHVKDFCEQNGFTFRVAKDTDTVKRFMVNYGNDGKPLKIEVSFRRIEIGPEESTRVNGIKVYGIEGLCTMKASAYAGRDKIRDLYDVAFICNRYWNDLSFPARALVRNAIEFKGIEQFDYLVQSQQDSLIDNDRLADAFLRMYERLGLLADEGEQEIIKSLGTVHTPAPQAMSLAEYKKEIRSMRQGVDGGAKQPPHISNDKEHQERS